MELKKMIAAGLENYLPLCDIPLGPGVMVVHPNLFIQAQVRTLQGRGRKVQRDHPLWRALREKAQRELSEVAACL